MRSNNPIFNRSEGFNRGGGHSSYGDPSTWQTGSPQGQQGYQPYGGVQTDAGATYGAPPEAPHATGVMTIDSVVQKTAISLGVVVITAIATWLITPDITVANADLGMLGAAMAVGSLGAFVLSLVNSFKRVISPALVLAFCVAEGVALGAFSKFIDAMFSTPDSGNLVIQAVIGTFAAFAGTLAAYKFFNIKVGAKFQTFVMAAVLGMVALSVMELVLGMFGSQFGLFGFGALGLVTAVVGLLLGVFMLILDFDFVEQGVANRLPERESWRAAFAITVALVWIYTNLLRLLAILNQD